MSRRYNLRRITQISQFNEAIRKWEDAYFRPREKFLTTDTPDPGSPRSAANARVSKSAHIRDRRDLLWFPHVILRYSGMQECEITRGTMVTFKNDERQLRCVVLKALGFSLSLPSRSLPSHGDDDDGVPRSVRAGSGAASRTRALLLFLAHCSSSRIPRRWTPPFEWTRMLRSAARAQPVLRGSRARTSVR